MSGFCDRVGILILTIEPAQLLLQVLAPAVTNRYTVPIRSVVFLLPAAWLAKLQSRFGLPDANHLIRQLPSIQQTGTHFEGCSRQPHLIDGPQTVLQRKPRWTTLAAPRQPRVAAEYSEHSVSELLTASYCRRAGSRPNRNGNHGCNRAGSSHYRYHHRKDHRSSTVHMDRDRRTRSVRIHTNMDIPNTAQSRRQYLAPNPSQGTPTRATQSRCETRENHRSLH